MKVEPRTQVPIIAVGAVTMFAALLTLIYIGSTTAFNDVISLTITGFYGSYFLPCAFLLYHRIKGQVAGKNVVIQDPSDFMEDQPSPSNEKIKEVEDPPSKPDAPAPAEGLSTAVLAWGPWHLPGILGIINNIYACAYMIFVIFWSVVSPVYSCFKNYLNRAFAFAGLFSQTFTTDLLTQQFVVAPCYTS